MKLGRVMTQVAIVSVRTLLLPPDKSQATPATHKQLAYCAAQQAHTPLPLFPLVQLFES
jgi:hypothetical protein